MPTLYWTFKGPRLGFFLGLCLFCPAILWGEVDITPLPSGKYRVVFSYSPPISAQSVSLAGSFNQWNKTANPLRYSRKTGRWKAVLILSAGRYSYKFVLNQRLWKRDRANPQKERDGFGGFNSLVILSKIPHLKSAKGDGKILESSLFHSVKPLSSEMIYQDLNELGEALIRLRTNENDVEGLWLWTLQPRKAYPMTRVLQWDGYDYYEARIPLKRAFSYVFLLRDGGKKLFFTQRGLQKFPRYAFRFSPGKLVKFTTPSWLRSAVFYQIFPERFCNGNKKNDPPYVQPWGRKPTFHNFFGGDLEGVQQKIPYLKELGINTIYFNPIFRAPSAHKYDTADYLTVDPHFGGNRVFQKLLLELKKNDIQVILDGVFNHTGPGFFAFLDILKNQEKSAYKNWYFIHKFPVKVTTPPPYEAWWGFAHHPQLNPKNPATRRYLLQVATHWIKAGCKGWRLDVPNEIAGDFWREFRKKVKRVDPQAYIVGEIWEDGRQWLQGDQFDGVMNYPWRKACIDFFARGSLSPSNFLRGLALYRLHYPQASLPALLNMLSSHDVPRFLTLCGKSLAKFKLAVVFQFTYIGAPCIYYGEEIGMTGGKDPQNRRCFPWNQKHWNKGLRSFYQRLIQIRKDCIELRRGTVEDLFVSDSQKVFALRREWKKDVTYLVFHNGKGKTSIEIDLPSKDQSRKSWRDLLTNKKFQAKKGRLSLTLTGYKALVLKGD